MQFGITRGKKDHNSCICRVFRPITTTTTSVAGPSLSATPSQQGLPIHKQSWDLKITNNNTKIIILIFQRVWTVFGGQRVIDLL